MQNTSSVSAFDLTDAYFSGVLSDIELFVFCFVSFHILRNIVVQEKSQHFFIAYPKSESLLLY